MEKHPDDWKDEGNAALRAGDTARAIELYTSAIEAAREQAVVSHAYYGNRSIAHLHLKHYEAAVSDAEAALDRKRDYVKGYATKGTALNALGRLDEAVATWERGLEACPGDSTLLAYLRQAQSQRAAAAGAAAGGGGAGGAGGAGSEGGAAGEPAPASTTPPSSTSTSHRPSSSLEGYAGSLRLLMLANFVFYLLPVGVSSTTAWLAFQVAAIIAHGLLVFNRFGRPQMNAMVRIAC